MGHPLPHINYLRIISATLDIAFIALIIFLLWFKLRGKTKKVSQWKELKRYYVSMLCPGIAFLVGHALLILNCEKNDSAFCGVAFISTIVSFSSCTFFFMMYTIYAYKRLSSIFRGTDIFAFTLFSGSREEFFWNAYTNTLVGVIILVCSAIVFNLVDNGSTIASLQPHDSSSLTLIQSISKYTFLGGCGLMIVLVCFGSVYCFYQMLWIILSTSSKLAKMKRTDDKAKVIALHRKLYALVGFSGFLTVLIIADVFLNRKFFLSF
jgi:hypothetical protein